MKLFNIIYFIIGYPYFLIQNILVSFISAMVQSTLAYRLEKFPWQVSMKDATEFIDKIQGDE